MFLIIHKNVLNHIVVILVCFLLIVIQVEINEGNNAILI